MLDINKIYLGDNLGLLKKLDDNSIHSCVSDFPYNLSFMGKKWDTIQNYYQWNYDRAKELLRVLKPGGYCLIFGGTRTHHRLVCAFEDAGFQIKDEMQWIYGSGFPKSYNISKGFDKKVGAKREVIGEYKHPTAKNGDRTGNKSPYQAENCHLDGSYELTSPTTKLAKQWDGWGTALKPAQEPIMVAQKPIEKNYCYNIEKYGVGGLNIDDCRIEGIVGYRSSGGFNSGGNSNCYGDSKGVKDTLYNKGRFPANIIFDEEAAELLDKQTGILKSGSNCVRRKEGSFIEHGGLGKAGDIQITYGDKGGASRFFYCAKASKKERTEDNQIENKHPTVKPTKLIKYLVKLITPPNGICLDICEGSGTHVKAILQLNKEGYNFKYIGFEKDKDSYDIACEREKINKLNE